MDEVHGSGVLVYLSATWLSELYQHVLATSLLEESGYDSNSGQQYALINLLTGLFPKIASVFSKLIIKYCIFRCGRFKSV